ncbi:MAG TPA: tetratricopeptide repeat protein [Woeseiaceae bacterium]|nr:tetratricopeptide repeat protein [Woeseiaceae bacterium]
MSARRILLGIAAAALGACASSGGDQRGTLAELEQVKPVLDEMYVDDSLDRAAESYRRYLEETETSALTPEAMRRLADLQLEREYGVISGQGLIEMEAPDAAVPGLAAQARDTVGAPITSTESDQEFERRASGREELLSAAPAMELVLPGAEEPGAPAGPREAIVMYQAILDTYPDYERNDQVLYQMSRAYDELGQPDEAMEVAQRLIARYPYSKYLDEAYFRRGEYFFVRRKFQEAEDAYSAIIAMGSSSEYYELALYKRGWTLYKREFYEDALHSYLAMLDYRLTIGYDFDQDLQQNDEHRVVDTFRVISLSFSNLGGPEVLDQYFAEYGRRSFADKIYQNLGEFYFEKLRYDDAASVYKSFVKLNPYHRVSPRFSMRVIEIYDAGGFPQLVLASKKEFAAQYSLDSEYWNYHAIEDSQQVIGLLKTNLADLANHYHALYQEDELVEERPTHFAEAQHWYREFLVSFPRDADTPPVNYQLADLLLENGDFGDAAGEYERTAYEYAPHEQAAAAGYAAVYAYRKQLDAAVGGQRGEVRQATVTSSLRFAEAFPGHEQAPVVLGAAADDLYGMKEFLPAIESAQKLIERYPEADASLRRAAWAVIANSSIDLAEYPQAEHAYARVLELTPPEDESRAAVIDGLAAAIYKQGEQAILLQDYQGAAGHFLRIKDVAPDSAIRASAEYDAAAALMKVEAWDSAADVLENFRESNPEHELNAEATKQLALVYLEDGQTERSAVEHERIAAEATDPELARSALLTAGELYDQAGSIDHAVRVFERYVEEYPAPLDVALETRTRLAEIFKSRADEQRYFAELRSIVAVDQEAGASRTDRSRYLAAQAAVVLAEQDYRHFTALKLSQPFEENLAEKQRRMDLAMQAFEGLVAYEVADVTAAATWYIAETYLAFSTALLESERPAGLSEDERAEYELVIEEEAFPFEERAIGVHEENFELLAGGIYNPWVQKSLDKLAVLMPGRYAKNEISGGFVGSIDTYAYRMPIAPPDVESADGVAMTPHESAEAVEATAQVGQPGSP